ncbi:MAG TPA: phage tail tip lysozyme [Trebonia sp.]
MTAGTRRNGTSKFGPYRLPADDRPGAPGPQVQDGRAGVEIVDDESYGFTPDDTIADGAIPAYGHENAKRYPGRHANARVKAARKRAGKVVPAAAVAATLAAGTAAVFGLVGGGQPQASHADTSLALHGPAASTPAAGVGHANGAAAAPVRVAAATAAGTARAPKHAKSAPSRAPAGTATAAAQSGGAAHATAAASAAAAPKHAAPAASSPAATHAAAATTLSCNLSYSMLPANVTAIVSFLLARGYSHNAAAGIVGNIYQESKGNPESVGMGGGGLIGWTPLPSGLVTGNATADLRAQLSALLTYNQGWSQYLPALNAAASPSAAADIYVTDFERAGIPAASTREASARNVARACGL